MADRKDDDSTGFWNALAILTNCRLQRDLSLKLGIIPKSNKELGTWMYLDVLGTNLKSPASCKIRSIERSCGWTNCACHHCRFRLGGDHTRQGRANLSGRDSRHGGGRCGARCGACAGDRCLGVFEHLRLKSWGE